jgi:hypothetical protein
MPKPKTVDTAVRKSAAQPLSAQDAELLRLRQAVRQAELLARTAKVGSERIAQPNRSN